MKRLRLVVIGVVFVLVFGVWLYLFFAFSHLTAAQLLMHFWPIYLAGAVLLIATLLGLRDE